MSRGSTCNIWLANVRCVHLVFLTGYFSFLTFFLLILYSSIMKWYAVLLHIWEKKWLARKSEKNRWNNSPSWIDKRKVHKNDVTLNTEQRKEQEEIWERDGHKNGQDRLEKDIMPQSETQKLKHTHLLNFLWLGTFFFYHSLLFVW